MLNDSLIICKRLCVSKNKNKKEGYRSLLLRVYLECIAGNKHVVYGEKTTGWNDQLARRCNGKNQAQ
jgi:hypothetical protein